MRAGLLRGFGIRGEKKKEGNQHQLRSTLFPFSANHPILLFLGAMIGEQECGFDDGKAGDPPDSPQSTPWSIGMFRRNTPVEEWQKKKKPLPFRSKVKREFIQCDDEKDMAE